MSLIGVMILSTANLHDNLPYSSTYGSSSRCRRAVTMNNAYAISCRSFGRTLSVRFRDPKYRRIILPGLLVDVYDRHSYFTTVRRTSTLVRTPPDFITTTTTCMKHSIISLLCLILPVPVQGLASTYRIVKQGLEITTTKI